MLGFSSLSIFTSISQKCVLKQVPQGVATIFQQMLSCAAVQLCSWGETLFCTEVAKKEKEIELLVEKRDQKNEKIEDYEKNVKKIDESLKE